MLTLLDTGATLKLWRRRHSWWSKERWLPNQQRDNTPQRPDRSKGSKNGNRLRHHPDSYCPRQTPSLLLKLANQHHPRIAKAAHSWLRSVTKPESTTSTQSSQDRRSAFPVGYSDKHSQKTKLNSKGKTKLSTILKTHTESFSRKKNRSRRVQWRRSKTPTTRPATSGLMSETKKNPVQSNDVAEERAGENEKRWNHRKIKWFILQLSSPACQKSMWRIPNMRRYAVAEFEISKKHMAPTIS